MDEDTRRPWFEQVQSGAVTVDGHSQTVSDQSAGFSHSRVSRLCVQKAPEYVRDCVHTLLPFAGDHKRGARPKPTSVRKKYRTPSRSDAGSSIWAAAVLCRLRGTAYVAHVAGQRISHAIVRARAFDPSSAYRIIVWSNAVHRWMSGDSSMPFYGRRNTHTLAIPLYVCSRSRRQSWATGRALSGTTKPSVAEDEPCACARSSATWQSNVQANWRSSRLPRACIADIGCVQLDHR